MIGGAAVTGTMLALAPAQAAGDARAGTPIELMVMREVRGESAAPGAEVRLSVNKPVAVEGGAIPYGTPAFGQVVRARGGGVLLRPGSIAIKLTRLVIGGREVPITGGFAARGAGGESDDVVKLVFAPIFVLFTSGNVGKVKAGQIVEGRLPPGFSLTPATTPAP